MNENVKFELNSIKVEVTELLKKWKSLDPPLWAIEDKISANEDSRAVLRNVPKNVSETKDRSFIEGEHQAWSIL